MSDLQLALLVLGAAIIFAVLAFNWWQERKFRNEAIERFDMSQADALMDSEFHFDASAILQNEESEPLTHHEKVFVDLSAAELESRTAASADLQALDKEVSSPEESVVTSNATEFSAVWDELEEEMAEPAVDAIKPTPVAYEEHQWHTDITDEEVAAEQASRIELNAEAGFDETIKTSQSELATENIASNSGHTETDALVLSTDIDPRIDLIAVLYLPQATTGDKLREFLLSVADVDKPIYVHGLDVDGIWQLMTREQGEDSFTRATFSIQLADRSGFISRNALNRFQHEVDRIGLKLNAQVEWQTAGDPWLAASELDQFCIDVDKMVGFHLVQGDNGPFTGTKFRGLVEAQGLVLGVDGAFHGEDERGARFFSIVNRDNHPFSLEMLRISVIHGVTFQLDIPRVKSCAEVFNQMVLTARQLENSLGAVLVDDNQRPLGEAQIEKIRQQLKIIHAKMTARGIIPGSATALRLFS